MLSSRFPGALAILWITALFFGAGRISLPAAENEPVDSVRPMVGTAAPGHTYPGAVYPFGFVQLSPDTGNMGWDHSSGYKATDPRILGFSHAHLSGTGGSDLGDILFQPTVGEIKLDPGDPKKPGSGYGSAFSHDNETASPGYYRVLLADSGIQVELTATAHAGFHQYTFPASDAAHVIIDLTHGIGRLNKVTDAQLTCEDGSTLSGYRRSSNWARDKTFYFVAKFSRPFDSYGFTAADAATAVQTPLKGTVVKGFVTFKTKAGESIQVKVGVSPTSIDEARKNLGAEIPGWDFAGTVASTRAAWEQELSTIDISTSDPAVRETFYTALYHSMLAPHFYNNADQSFEGADHQAHPADFNYYSTFSIWDQFRAWHPLMTIIQPKRVNDLLKSMLLQYQLGNRHQLPVWPLCSNETACMIGYNSMPIILDAYIKGFRDYDVEKMYAAMRDTALNDRDGQKEFHTIGYISDGKGPDHQQTVSRALEYAYDDWCIAGMAHALGKTDDEKMFLKYAANYRNVFDPETKLMRGKTADGQFVSPFDPILCERQNYTEADAWQYAFYVPHDPQGLVDLMGGDAGFSAQLDKLFDQSSEIHHGIIDISGLIGQCSQGDEQCHHVAYLYDYVGEPDKTEMRVRQIMTTLYTNKPDGLCGNDDCGQMSAWYVMSALGFYEVNPASGVYVLGSPLVDRAIIHLDPKYYPGGTFTITAKDNSKDNIYIQSATLNGQPLTHTYFTHADLVKGGELVLQMGSKPSETWGRDKSARPPSMTVSN